MQVVSNTQANYTRTITLNILQRSLFFYTIIDAVLLIKCSIDVSLSVSTLLNYEYAHNLLPS